LHCREFGAPVMAYSLIALGSNLGDRAARLQQAIAALGRLPQTRLAARSRWHESAPVGGPAGQQAFLNGAALLSTSLSPEQLFDQLTSIEAACGRKRDERWSARTLDLDLLLYDELVRDSPELAIPHPRMVYRPFVLRPAAEVAAWMVHAESGWTVDALLEHLKDGQPSIAVAGDPGVVEQMIASINAMLDTAISEGPAVAEKRPTIALWSENSDRPTLLLAAASAGIDRRQLRKMLNLPATGPVAWISADPAPPELDEALAAVQAVWSALAR
jgi:2-amino-4-hydroxy-6-hydroxymethyldihydropteridine diphosphokinase